VLKKLGSIKFTIVLLILLVTFSIIGTLVPQGWTDNQYREKYINNYSLMKKLQLFDVYHSYWYTALLAIFCLNLIACSTLGLKPLMATLRSANYIGEITDLSKMPFHIEMPIPSDSIIQRVISTFTRNFYQLRYSDSGKGIYYFERGKIGRLGPLITHASIIIILLGGILVGRLGFNEYINVSIGKTVSVPHSDFQVRADDFKFEVYANSQTPKEYTSIITIIDNGVQRVTKSIEVNHPLKYHGVRFYQSSYGTLNSVELSKKSSGLVGIYSLGRGQDFQVPYSPLRIRMIEYIPDFVIDNSGKIGSRSNEPRNPAALLELYDGNNLKYKSWVFQKFPDFHASDESEYSLKLLSTGYYTGLQVSRSPFLSVVWVGFLLMVAGMFLSFYMPYKRIWMKVSAKKLEIGGSSYKNRSGFEKELRRIKQIA